MIIYVCIIYSNSNIHIICTKSTIDIYPTKMMIASWKGVCSSFLSGHRLRCFLGLVDLLVFAIPLCLCSCSCSCLFVCLLACSLACLFVCLLACLLACCRCCCLPVCYLVVWPACWSCLFWSSSSYGWVFPCRSIGSWEVNRDTRDVRMEQLAQE